MSAYVVDVEHVTALLVAGLATDDELSWLERDLEDELAERGVPFTMAMVERAQELRRELTLESAGRVGAMLWAENVRSVNWRYSEDDLEDVYEPPNDLLWRVASARTRIDPAAVLGALSCLEYQSCEGPGWAKSEACRFVEALRRVYIRRLPGYRPGEVHAMSDLFGKEVTA